MTSKTTRRCILAGLATVPALASFGAPAIAGIDPIYPAIEAHRAALASLYDVLDRRGEYEKAMFAKGKKSDRRFNEKEDAANGIEIEAAWALAVAVPRTLASTIDRLRYLREERAIADLLVDNREYLDALVASTEMALCDIARLKPPAGLLAQFEAPVEA